MKRFYLMAALSVCFLGLGLVVACSGTNDTESTVHNYETLDENAPELKGCLSCACDPSTCNQIVFTTCPSDWLNNLENVTCKGAWEGGDADAYYVQACATLGGSMCGCLTLAQLTKITGCD
jgi:hypothetical protein